MEKGILTVNDELKEFKTKDINDKSFRVYKPGCNNITELGEEYETLISALNYFVSSFKLCKVQLSSNHDYLTVTLIRNNLSDDKLKKWNKKNKVTAFTNLNKYLYKGRVVVASSKNEVVDRIKADTDELDDAY